MDRSVLILALNIALIALVWILRSKAKKDPSQFWVYLLYGLQLGPRSDVKYMTKIELYESGVRFVTWGLIFTSVLFAVAIAEKATNNPSDASLLLRGLQFGSALLAAMGFVGGSYLLLRGAFRSPSYSPPPSGRSDA